jgi:ubiquinone/menaquinone biosynthesis C-methylase UbiE
MIGVDMLMRVLEAEVMNTSKDAREYDAMDHTEVNAIFVSDLLAELSTTAGLQILDLGTGTAQIPIELCRRVPQVRVTAVDAARSMLALARKNVAAADLTDRIELELADAKHLPFSDGAFLSVISNSVVHHVPEPRAMFAEAVRLTISRGLLFHRDLARPRDEAQLEYFVATYASDATPHQQKLFADSLRAALTLAEVQDVVAQLGFRRNSVGLTSDRHWTWSVRKP